MRALAVDSEGAGQQIQTGASARAGKMPKRGHVCQIKAKYMGTMENYTNNKKKVKTERFWVQIGGNSPRTVDTFKGVVVGGEGGGEEGEGGGEGGGEEGEEGEEGGEEGEEGGTGLYVQSLHQPLHRRKRGCGQRQQEWQEELWVLQCSII
jgi:hypothetical protein